MRRFICLLTLASLSTACGRKPTDDDYDDVAAGVGALVANESGGEVGSIDDATVASRGGLPAGLTAIGSGKLQGRRRGLEYEYSLTCLDASGAPAPACGAATDSARLTVNWRGELDLPRWTGEITRAGDWSITGLKTEVATFNGTGSFDVSAEFNAVFRNDRRSFHLAYAAQYAGIEVRTADRLPIGGEIRYDVHAERTRSRLGREVEVEFDVDVLVQFGPTGTATVTLDADRSYSLDIRSGQVRARIERAAVRR